MERIELMPIGYVVNSCNKSTHPDNIKQLESTSTEITNEGNFRYVEYDGHQYLIWITGSYRGGICHSPNCPCKIN